MSLLTLDTAFKTPLPLILFVSKSLNSNASNFPVDAPDGTIPRNGYGIFSNIISHSTVGLPLLSKISLAVIFLIFIYFAALFILFIAFKSSGILCKYTILGPSLNAVSGLG